MTNPELVIGNDAKGGTYTAQLINEGSWAEFNSVSAYTASQMFKAAFAPQNDALDDELEDDEKRDEASKLTTQMTQQQSEIQIQVSVNATVKATL